MIIIDNYCQLISGLNISGIRSKELKQLKAILTLPETWLTENQNLLDYVELSGYDLYYNNRENKRGGRVSAYVRESLKCKIRKDYSFLDTDIERLWLELQGTTAIVFSQLFFISRTSKQNQN